MSVICVWWSNLALNICILIKGSQFCLFWFPFGFSLRKCVSNNFKELHEKNKTTTLGGEHWWQGGFLGAALHVCGQQRLEIPWVQILLPVVPLGFASRGRELKAGHVVRKIRAWVEFQRVVWKYAENSALCVCVHTLRRTRGLWSLLVGLHGKASNCCGPCGQTGHLGRRVPLPQCWQFVLRGLLSSSEQGSGSQALSVDRPAPSTALSCMIKTDFAQIHECLSLFSLAVDCRKYSLNNKIPLKMQGYRESQHPLACCALLGACILSLAQQLCTLYNFLLL